MYAILDIETTGGQYDDEGITEIAIYKFDGTEIVDQFISLVNPEKPIQPFVVKLTGINNQMLVSAPKFYEIAKRIIEITQDCIIVAHNTVFDFRILQTEFRRLGYDFQAKTLCTVELSKILIPNQASYSLGKLVKALGIPMVERHRAGGDALATVKLFKLLLDKDLQKIIIKENVKTEIIKSVLPKFLIILDTLPTRTGVFYVHNTNGEIIYIGKSKSIKKKVNQLFTSLSRRAKMIQNEVESVSFEETGSELIALIKENEEILNNKPKYNSLRSKKYFLVGLYSDTDNKGLLTLKLQKADGRKNEICFYSSMREGKSALYCSALEYDLCKKSLGLTEIKGKCFKEVVTTCNGLCNADFSVQEHNERLANFISLLGFENKTRLIVDRGRNISERSAILIEEGNVIGYTFYDLNYQINNIKILKNIIVPIQNNKQVKFIIQSYLRKNNVKKIIEF